MAGVNACEHSHLSSISTGLHIHIFIPFPALGYRGYKKLNRLPVLGIESCCKIPVFIPEISISRDSLTYSLFGISFNAYRLRVLTLTGILPV